MDNALRSRSAGSSSASRTSSSKSRSSERVELHELVFPGVHREPSRASASEFRTISSNSLSDSGVAPSGHVHGHKRCGPHQHRRTSTPRATSSTPSPRRSELKPAHHDRHQPATCDQRRTPTRRSWPEEPGEPMFRMVEARPIRWAPTPRAGYSSAQRPEGLIPARNLRPDVTEVLLRPLLERAGDHEPLDLVGALVDLGDLGVSHHPLHRVLLDIP